MPKKQKVNVEEKVENVRTQQETIEEIYGFEISHEIISAITDRVIHAAREWQNCQRQ